MVDVQEVKRIATYGFHVLQIHNPLIDIGFLGVNWKGSVSSLRLHNNYISNFVSSYSSRNFKEETTFLDLMHIEWPRLNYYRN